MQEGGAGVEFGLGAFGVVDAADADDGEFAVGALVDFPDDGGGFFGHWFATHAAGFTGVFVGQTVAGERGVGGDDAVDVMVGDAFQDLIERVVVDVGGDLYQCGGRRFPRRGRPCGWRHRRAGRRGRPCPGARVGRACWAN